MTCGACARRTSRHGRPTLGPCALPAHDDTVHQDADGVIWAELRRFPPPSRPTPTRAAAPSDAGDDRNQQIQALQAEIAQLRAQLGQPQEAP